jgi:hypothetical protein
LKRPFQNQTKKTHEKNTPNEKDIVERNPKVTERNPPSPYPGRATPAHPHPQSRVSAKALESLRKLFTMVCSTPFVLARRIGGFWPIWQFRLFGRDRMERKHILRRNRHRVSSFLSHRIVESLQIMIFDILGKSLNHQMILGPPDGSLDFF